MKRTLALSLILAAAVAHAAPPVWLEPGSGVGTVTDLESAVLDAAADATFASGQVVQVSQDLDLAELQIASLSNNLGVVSGQVVAATASVTGLSNGLNSVAFSGESDPALATLISGGQTAAVLRTESFFLRGVTVTPGSSVVSTGMAWNVTGDAAAVSLGVTGHYYQVSSPYRIYADASQGDADIGPYYEQAGGPGRIQIVSAGGWGPYDGMVIWKEGPPFCAWTNLVPYYTTAANYSFAANLDYSSATGTLSAVALTAPNGAFSNVAIRLTPNALATASNFPSGLMHAYPMASPGFIPYWYMNGDDIMNDPMGDAGTWNFPNIDMSGWVTFGGTWEGSSFEPVGTYWSPDGNQGTVTVTWADAPVVTNASPDVYTTNYYELRITNGVLHVVEE